MSLAAITGMPAIAVGHAQIQGLPVLTALATLTLNAVNAAIILVGHLVWEDGNTHTIDTTGSSSIQWRSGSVTFANAGTTFTVGIGGVDSTTGPPVRATNAAGVITFDVAAALVGGGGGVTANAWQTSVPTTGSKTIANMDLVALSLQMTARGGTDSVIVTSTARAVATTRPTVTQFISGSFADSQKLPNAVVVASDGTRGYFYGGYASSIGLTSQSWNNTSGTKEYGNVLRFPFPVRAYGIIVANNFAGDCDLVLYSDPFGTPAAISGGTISVDLNQISASSAVSDGKFAFSSPINLDANTDYAVIAKPTSSTSVTMPYKTFDSASHQNCEPLGTDCYAINRDTGAFAAQNSSKDRFAIGLLVGAFGVVYPRPGLQGVSEGMFR